MPRPRAIDQYSPLLWVNNAGVGARLEKFADYAEFLDFKRFDDDNSCNTARGLDRGLRRMRYSNRTEIVSWMVIMATMGLGSGCTHPLSLNSPRSFHSPGGIAPLAAGEAAPVHLASAEVVVDEFSGPSGGCHDCAGGCGGFTGPSYPGTCGSCATGQRGGLSGLMLPLMSTRLACGSGCGGVYWGEWINDPVACCDPCNDCGCWVERPCCHGGPLSSCLRSLRGRLKHACQVALYGYRPSGCGDCDSYAGEYVGESPYLEGPFPAAEEYGEEIPPGDAAVHVRSVPQRVTEHTRLHHGRSPHRVISRRLRH